MTDLWIVSREPPHIQQIGISTALIFDRVAVHPTLNLLNERKPGGEWTVTHLVSGRAVENRLTCAAMALDMAIQLDQLPEMSYHRNVVVRSPRVQRIAKKFREMIVC